MLIKFKGLGTREVWINPRLVTHIWRGNKNTSRIHLSGADPVLVRKTADEVADEIANALLEIGPE